MRIEGRIEVIVCFWVLGFWVLFSHQVPFFGDLVGRFSPFCEEKDLIEFEIRLLICRRKVGICQVAGH